MEQEARDLILYILDADRRHMSSGEILAGTMRRLSALVVAQRERDAAICRRMAESIRKLPDAPETTKTIVAMQFDLVAQEILIP